MSCKSVIKYHDPNPFDWQVNDVVMDAYSAFQTRCYEASPMAICELYIEMGLMYEIPFHQFILKLANEKKQEGACKFRLITDLPYSLTKIDFHNNLKEKLKDSKFKLDFPAIDDALVELIYANPEV